MFSRCEIQAKDALETKSAGRFLAYSLYREHLTVLIEGELGAGKTTFAQGFATGLGVEDRVLSPSYALEQRYERFTHIDLYRLSETQAREFLTHSEDVRGIRLIEWAERIKGIDIGPHIRVSIDEEKNHRRIGIDFLDEPVPEDKLIDAWVNEVRLPKHIQHHIAAVTHVADTLATFLIATGMVLRKEALHAAARTHDLLRFVDFPTWNGDTQFTPSDEDRNIWKACKDTYGVPHESAACAFLRNQGYASIGEILKTHRGNEEANSPLAPKTTEQKLLAYADKRVMFDKIATLEERFSDLGERYGNGRESEYHRQWLGTMKRIERELFPRDVPALEPQ